MRRSSASSLDRWEYWWEYNKEPYLRLRSRMRAAPPTPAPGFLTGRGSAHFSENPLTREVREVLIPAVLPLLSDAETDVVDAASLCLARMAPDGEVATVLSGLIETLGHEERNPRESATAALGALGSHQGVFVLRHLVEDGVEGRRRTWRGREVDERTRALAAASLGLLGEQNSARALQRIAADRRLNTKRELKAMAILALGLIPAAQDESVPFLLNALNDKDLPRVARAQAPIALGRLHERRVGPSRARAALQELLKRFEAEGTDLDLRRSLAISLGMLASVEDVAVLKALVNATLRGADAPTRSFSIMALAQIGSRDAPAERNAELHQVIQNLLLSELVRPTRASNQPYAALALGVYGHGQSQELRQLLGAKLIEALQTTDNPSHVAAMGLALGLLEHGEAAGLLWDRCQSSHTQVRGYLALALGLMGAVEQVRELRPWLLDPAVDTLDRMQLARAVALIGDTEGVDLLVQCLERANTLYEVATAAQAVGMTTDRRALPALLGLLQDPGRTPLQRSFACTAIGLIAERTELRWNVPYRVNSNYLLDLETQYEILKFL